MEVFLVCFKYLECSTLSIRICYLINELIKSKNMLSLSEEFLCVVVLSRHWKGNAASYFKIGAVDVWFEDISNIELEMSFARLGSAAKTRIQAEEHQYELQRVNTDLQKSMDMLMFVIVFQIVRI